VDVVIVGGRIFSVETVPTERGTWLAAVGEGAAPKHWTRIGDFFDSEGEAFAAAVGGIGRLMGRERARATAA
jgi:hypothetical protein